jgi:hypothetical protein
MDEKKFDIENYPNMTPEEWAEICYWDWLDMTAFWLAQIAWTEYMQMVHETCASDLFYVIERVKLQKAYFFARDQLLYWQPLLALTGTHNSYK